MQLDKQNSDFVDGTSEEAPLTRICSRLQEIICCWKGKINDIAHADVLCQIDEGVLALLWGAVSCYAHMCIVGANPSLMVELADLKIGGDSKIGAHLKAHSDIIEVLQLQSPLRMANINFKILSTTKYISSCESITPQGLINVCTSSRTSSSIGL